MKTAALFALATLLSAMPAAAQSFPQPGDILAEPGSVAAFDSDALALGLTVYTIDFSQLPNTPAGQSYAGPPDFSLYTGFSGYVQNGVFYNQAAGFGPYTGRFDTAIDGLYYNWILSVPPAFGGFTETGAAGTALESGFQGDDAYLGLWDTGYHFGEVTLLTYAVGTPTPEASSAWLLLSGLLPVGLIVARRRRG